MAHVDFQNVKDKADLVKIIGQFVTLQPKRGSRGGEHVGLCPFHNDHKPSMSVVPAKGLFHCFACQTGGDIFTFVQKFLGYSPLEALRFVADQAGVKLVERHTEVGVSNAELRAACRFALAYYRGLLAHRRHGEAARALLERRGVPADQVEAFAIGCGGPADGLVRTARAQGFDVEALKAAGLVRENGSDHLAGRLVFPILDAAGAPIAFGGRLIVDDPEAPKYLNTRETAIYRKGEVLYGLALARRGIQQAGVVLVAEGYMDVIALSRVGISNAVGVLGTALTPEHAVALRRLAHTVVLVPDQDDAGLKAAVRGVETCVAAGLAVKVAQIVGTAKDVDDAVRAGPLSLIDHDGLAWRFGQVLDCVGQERVVAVEKEARALARALVNLPPVRRRAALEALAKASGMPIDVIVDEAAHAA